MSPYASRQSTGKMTNRPHFAHILGGSLVKVVEWLGPEGVEFGVFGL